MSIFRDNLRSVPDQTDEGPIEITPVDQSTAGYAHGRLRRSFGGWTVSLLTHSIVLVVAATVVPQMNWQTEVARGEAAMVTLFSPAVPASQQAMPIRVEVQPVEKPTLDPPETEVVRSEQKVSTTIAPDGFEPTPVAHILDATPKRAERKDEPKPEDQQAEPLPKREPSVTVEPRVAAIPTTAGARVKNPPVKLPENKPPAYPEYARLAGHQGRVMLAVVVNSEGNVSKVIVESSSGFASLDQAAVDSVSQWRFTPATEDDAVVDAEIVVPIRFFMRER